MIRAELHAHTGDDVHDRVPHSARALVERAAELGYGALAITLHDIAYDPAPIEPFARERGITMIRGLERTIAGKHVLLLNFPGEALGVRTLEEVGELKRAHPEGLVVAPHPFFPIASALGRDRLDGHRSLWDAVEVNAMFVLGADWNRRARAWAEANGVPLVGNADVHRLSQLGSTWSEVAVEPGASADAVCAAIRAGHVRVRANRLSYLRAGLTFAQMTVGGIRGRLGI